MEERNPKQKTHTNKYCKTKKVDLLSGQLISKRYFYFFCDSVDAADVGLFLLSLSFDAASADAAGVA